MTQRNKKVVPSAPSSMERYQGFPECLPYYGAKGALEDPRVKMEIPDEVSQFVFKKLHDEGDSDVAQEQHIITAAPCN